MKAPPVAVREFKKPKEMHACPAVFFTRNAEGVLGINSDGYVVLWDAASTKLLKTLHLPKGHYGPNEWMSPDRRTLAIGGEDATHFIDTQTLKATKTLPFDAACVSWSKDGEFFAATSYHKRDNPAATHVFRSADNKEIASFVLPKYADNPVFWGNTADLIFAGDSAIFTWNVSDKKTAKRAKFVTNIWSAGWSSDGSVFVYRKGSKLSYLDAKTWKSHTISVPDKADRFAIAPDGKRLAMTVGNTIVIWDLAANEACFKWKRPNYGEAISVDFSPDGQQLACTPDHEPHVLDFRVGAPSLVHELPKPKRGEIQCLNMVGPDDLMDVDGWDPINPVVVKCSVCKTIDLNAVTEPYVVARKIEAPVDMAPGVAGNLLVRDTMKRVLEIVAPGQCKFYPTIHRKTRQPTAWLLAVPQHIQQTAKPKGKKCAKCGEPLEWAEDEATNSPTSEKEIFKSRNLRGEAHEHLTYFSVRLETLVKKLKLRGMVRSYDCKQTPSPEDIAWVEEKCKRVQLANRKAKPAAKRGQDDVAGWFNDYLKQNAKKNPVAHDFAAAEKKLGVKLPATYQRFLATVGTKKFKDLDGEEEFNAHILPPKQLKVESCVEGDDDEAFKGLIFAVTEHGDAFYFDTSGKGTDYEVRKHDHEIGSYEPYARNFAECIKRFAPE